MSYSSLLFLTFCPACFAFIFFYFISLIILSLSFYLCTNINLFWQFFVLCIEKQSMWELNVLDIFCLFVCGTSFAYSMKFTYFSNVPPYVMLLTLFSKKLLFLFHLFSSLYLISFFVWFTSYILSFFKPSFLL